MNLSDECVARIKENLLEFMLEIAYYNQRLAKLPVKVNAAITLLRMDAEERGEPVGFVPPIDQMFGRKASRKPHMIKRVGSCPRCGVARHLGACKGNNHWSKQPESRQVKLVGPGLRPEDYRDECLKVTGITPEQF